MSRTKKMTARATRPAIMRLKRASLDSTRMIWFAGTLCETNTQSKEKTVEVVPTPFEPQRRYEKDGFVRSFMTLRHTNRHTSLNTHPSLNTVKNVKNRFPAARLITASLQPCFASQKLSSIQTQQLPYHQQQTTQQSAIALQQKTFP